MQISVIIPTLNEAENIAWLVPFLFENQSGSTLEVIVVDAQSTDDTATIASSLGAKVLQSSQKCRAAQMNLGAQAAKGDVLYFVHADTKPLASYVSDIEASLAQGYDAGCYRYQFDSDRLILKINAFFTRFDRIYFRGGDQTLYVKREVFEALQGFDEYYTIMEDYDFLIRLRANYRFHIMQKSILVSARKYDTNSWLRVQLANLKAFRMFFAKKHPDEIRATYKQMLDYR